MVSHMTAVTRSVKVFFFEQIRSGHFTPTGIIKSKEQKKRKSFYCSQKDATVNVKDDKTEIPTLWPAVILPSITDVDREDG